MSLEQLFAFIDKDKSKQLSMKELTLGLKSVLTDEEIVLLFQAVDRDQSNEISYDELMGACGRIHCGYVMDKVKRAIDRGDLSVDKVFQTVDSDGNGAIDIVEFNEMISLLYDKVGKTEVDELFKHVDKRGTGKVTLEDLKKALA